MRRRNHFDQTISHLGTQGWSRDPEKRVGPHWYAICYSSARVEWDRCWKSEPQQATIHPIDLAACKFQALYDFMMRYSGVRGEVLCNFFFMYVCIIIGFQDGKKECLYKLWWCYVVCYCMFWITGFVSVWMWVA